MKSYKFRGLSKKKILDYKFVAAFLEHRCIGLLATLPYLTCPSPHRHHIAADLPPSFLASSTAMNRRITVASLPAIAIALSHQSFEILSALVVRVKPMFHPVDKTHRVMGSSRRGAAIPLHVETAAVRFAGGVHPGKRGTRRG